MANIAVSNTPGLYGISTVNVLNNAQQLLQILDNNGNVNFALDPVTSNTTVLAYYVGSGSGTYGNTQVAAYLPTDPTIQSIETSVVTVQTNLTNFETYANATFGTSSYGNTNVAAYLPTYTGSLINSSSIVTLTSEVGALQTNTAGLQTQINTVNANLGTATNNITTLFANAATQETEISGLSANITAANAAIVTVQANLTSFETYANATFATGGGSSYGNTNVAAYLSHNSIVYIGNGAGATELALNSPTTIISGGNGEISVGAVGGNLSVTNTNGVWLESTNLTLQGSGDINALNGNLSISGNATLGNVISTSGYFWANGTAYSTAVNYGNTQVTALLSTYNIPVNGTTLEANGSISTSSTVDTIIGAGTASGAISAPNGGLGIGLDAYIKGIANVGSLQSSGNVTSTNGYFWANGTVYSTGTSSTPFTGNLAGNILIDTVNQRVFANAYPLSTPSSSVVGNYFSNYLQNAPVYIGGVLQAPPAPTGSVNNPGVITNMVISGNIGLQSSYQTSSNRTISGALLYLGVTPVTANSMTAFDRVRGSSVVLEVNPQGKGWGGSALSAQLAGGAAQVSVIGNGTLNSSIGQLSAVTVTPQGGTANVVYGSGSYSLIAMSASNGSSNAGNVQYARLFTGSISGFTANLTVQQAIGLHTTSGWAGTIGTTSGAATAYALLNQDASTQIQTNGNIVVTGNLIMGPYQETVATSGTGGAITINVATGTIQQLTLTSSITSLSFTNMPAGGSVTLIITQGGSGNNTLTTTGIKYAGGSSTLSTASGAIDILNILFDGTNYYGSLVKGFA